MLRIGIGVKKSGLYYTTCLADPGEGQNLINQAFLRTHWKSCVKRLDVPKRRNATGRQ